MKWTFAFLLCARLLAQQTSPQTPTAPPVAQKTETPPPAQPDEEVRELGTALSEAGNSPADYVRVLEAHLAKHPDTSRRPEIERALAKAAIEGKDDKRIILYGERVLGRDGTVDVQLVDRLARAYLATDDKTAAQKALFWARKFDDAIVNLRKQPPTGKLSPAQWSDELDKAEARGLVLQARATGNSGELAPAAALAKRSWEMYPTSEGAREWGRWASKTGDTSAAVEHYADAFTIEDPRSTEGDRARDRVHMGELYVKAKGSETGLGDLILRAYDRTSSLMSERIARLKAKDPNVKASNILEFTLPGANGLDLKLADLRGKTVVFDFWATWCGPCRVQRPLYEQVASKFKDRKDVVFLSVNTDEDRSLVPAFLKAQKWTNPVYYDGGLTENMKVNSIPTTLIVDRTGQVSSRMNGFIPERFVDLLTDRIQETLQ